MLHCVVPENIHPPPPHGGQQATGILRGGRVQKEVISEGVGGCLPLFFSRGLSKIGEFLVNNSFFVEQAIIYFNSSGRRGAGE